MAFVQSLIRQTVWKLLPVPFRRKLLSGFTSAFAPKIDIQASPEHSIIVVGCFQSATGLGQSARLCYSALKAENIPVKAIDLTAELSQPTDHPFHIDHPDDVSGQGTMILHINSPLIPLAMMKLGARIIQKKYIIGYWAWELPQIPSNWHAGIRYVHEIWVPSTFTQEAILSSVKTKPVHILPHPVAQSSSDTSDSRPENTDRFEVLMVFNIASGFSRKNPIAAIVAFRLAFGNDQNVLFTIKTLNADHYPDGIKMLQDAIGNASNIELQNSYMSAEEMEAIYTRADVVISMHRAEGFGLTIAEAMLHGKAVIATNWSGNIDFMNEDNAIPISYDFIEAKDAQNTYDYPEMLWANANVDEAAAALIRLRDDEALRAKLGKAAARQSRINFGTAKYAETVLTCLGFAK